MKKAGWLHVQTKLNWVPGHNGDDPLYRMIYKRDCNIFTKEELNKVRAKSEYSYRYENKWQPFIHGGCGLDYASGFKEELKSPMLNFLRITKKNPLTAFQAESLTKFHYSKVVETPLSDFYLNGFLPTKWTRKLDLKTNG